VVDDDPMIIRLMERILDDAGYRTVSASDGQAGLQCVRDQHPALVVLDVMMPKLDGLEVTRALRAEAETSAVPIILLSARALPADVAIGLDAGANDYVVKPFDITDLLERIARLLS